MILSPVLVFSYKFPLWLSLSLAGAVLLPAFFRGYLLDRKWPTRSLIVALILAAFSTVYATAFPTITAERLILFALSISVYISLVAVDRALENLERWTSLVILGVTGLSLIGPFVTDFAVKHRYFEIPWSRLFPVRLSEVMDPNHLASLIAMTFPLALATSRGATRRWTKGAVWCSVVILFGVLIITESRAGYLAALSGIALMLLFFCKKLWIVYSAAGVAGIFFMLKVGHVTMLAQLFGSGAVGTWESRRELWNRAISMIQDFPFTGIGAGTFGKVAPTLYPLLIDSPDVELHHAHNLYLQVPVDLGIPGLAAFVALLSVSIFLGWKAYFSFSVQRHHSGANLAAGYLSGLFAWGIHGFFDTPLWLVKPSAVPFFYMGMLVALHRATDNTGSLRGDKDKPVGRLVNWQAVLTFLLWILISLVAISFVGEHPYWALVLAIGGGIYLGYEVSLMPTKTCANRE